MGELKFTYPPGYGKKFGLAKDPAPAVYPDDLYPAETLEKFRKQGVVIEPVNVPPAPPAGGNASAPAPTSPGAGDKNAGHGAAADDPTGNPPTGEGAASAQTGSGGNSAPPPDGSNKGSKKGGAK